MEVLDGSQHVSAGTQFDSGLSLVISSDSPPGLSEKELLALLGSGVDESSLAEKLGHLL